MLAEMFGIDPVSVLSKHPHAPGSALDHYLIRLAAGLEVSETHRRADEDARNGN